MATKSEADAIIAQIFGAFEASGHLDYGESLSMKEHMLQTAYLAERDRTDDRSVVAALLHDYGHLICNLPNNTFEEGKDNRHEAIGAAAMGSWFDDDIVNAVQLHVDAKRYLCAVNPNYVDRLSEASKLTMAVQGGPMSPAEMEAFRQHKGHAMAVRVRLYDDRGKLAEMDRPDLDHYIPKIKTCLR